MDKDVLRWLERGRETYENKEYDEAEIYLLKVLEVESRFADVMNMLGVISHDRGDIVTAKEYFEKALDLNPRYTEAALNLAVTYNEQGQYEKARETYGQITNLHSGRENGIEPFARGKLANMHSELGRAYAELQMFEKAILQYRESLSLCPDFVDIRTRLGQTLKDAGEIDSALAELKLAKTMRPGYLPARISLGVTYLAMNDKLSAKNEWKEVLDIDPENKTANMYVKMVENLIAQQEAEEAGMHLEVEEETTQTSSDNDEISFSIDDDEKKVTWAPPEDPDLQGPPPTDEGGDEGEKS